MGKSIKVVAVFEIHMLKTAAANMNPSIRNLGRTWSPPLALHIRTIPIAKRRWTPHRSTPFERKKPPNKSKTNGCP